MAVSSRFRIAAAMLACCAFHGAAWAQYGRPQILRNVGIDQKLNRTLPLEAAFTDENGQAVRLGRFFHGKPVILALVYYECPMLCNMELNALFHSLRRITLDAGTDFEVLAVSFDAREGPALAAAKKRTYLESYNRPGAAAGLHFLTGKEPQIRQLTDAVGFHYAYDAALNQFAHASGIMIATPEGRLSRYFYGIQYPERDLRLGLVEASANKIGTPADQILLFCFHYDPKTGKYGFLIANVIRVLGAATVLGLAAFVLIMLRRERRGELAVTASSPARGAGRPS